MYVRYSAVLGYRSSDVSDSPAEKFTAGRLVEARSLMIFFVDSYFNNSFGKLPVDF